MAENRRGPPGAPSCSCAWQAVRLVGGALRTQRTWCVGRHTHCATVLVVMPAEAVGARVDVQMQYARLPVGHAASGLRCRPEV